MASRKRSKLERQLSQIIKPPAGYETGMPSVKVTAEMSMYPKAPTPSGPPARPYKPKPMPVRIVGMVEKARLGRR